MLDQPPPLPALCQDDCDALTHLFWPGLTPSPTCCRARTRARTPRDPRLLVHRNLIIPAVRMVASAPTAQIEESWSQRRVWRRRHRGDRPPDILRWLKHRGASCTKRLLGTLIGDASHLGPIKGKTEATRGVRKLSLNCLFAGRNNNNFDLCRPPGN